jgi:hypothetical protein
MWLLTQQGDMINLDQCHDIRTIVHKDTAEVAASSSDMVWTLCRGTEAECREMVATIFNGVVNDAIAIRLQQGKDA